MFKTVFTVMCSFLIIAGLLAMAGSGGDCDGKCMENANTMSEMLMVIGVGFSMIVAGSVGLLKVK